MGAITRAAANNITTGGVILPAGINDASVASITALAQVSAGDGITLISSQTASSSASLSFTGIDNTYRTYLFKFINCHPSSAQKFSFNLSTDNGSNYNVTKTTTMFRAQHDEAGTSGNQYYESGNDVAQSTGYAPLSEKTDTANDASISGTLYLFNPSSTTYVKHFMSHTNTLFNADTYCQTNLMGGYGNTTSAINAIDFKFASGNIDSGTIYMYGIA